MTGAEVEMDILEYQLPEYQHLDSHTWVQLILHPNVDFNAVSGQNHSNLQIKQQLFDYSVNTVNKYTAYVIFIASY